MSRPILTFPPTFLKYTQVDWDIDWREQASGNSVAGRRNINLNRLPRWVGKSTLQLFKDQIAQWRAIRLAARGMTGIFRIRMADYINQKLEPGDAVPFSDGAIFDDGTGFEAEYTVRCDAGAAAGATEIEVNLSTANDVLQVGQFLSHDDWPFAVVAIEDNVLRIEMPLRRAIPAGDLINLRGTGLFEMVAPMTGNPAYDNTLTSRPTFESQEWLR
jgi:hypothetical protein